MDAVSLVRLRLLAPLGLVLLLSSEPVRLLLI
jgi:hypothetical protein